ncbi:hypothetical protein DSO57_1032945 [Entomophthora muscae]|uniref:Uncharacterized protein n=1 Tax=Entomophthora muscae TaxID=34485 RepID=A0ACC2T0G6_9FUNG|nr:hypothetical protein DSO57_1032945 [Entomophthora muscae]
MTSSLGRFHAALIPCKYANAQVVSLLNGFNPRKMGCSAHCPFSPPTVAIAVPRAKGIKLVGSIFGMVL